VWPYFYITVPVLYVDLSIWESIRQCIKTSATESLGYYELKDHKL